METNVPRLVVAAPKSGSGKTMIVCGIIRALKKRGLNVAAFKCGPDYIDPMFHRKVLGVETGNIDTFFTDENLTKYIFQKESKGADIVITEGVMGYYDGLGGISEKGSSYETAKTIKANVILTVDGKGASVSLAAVIKGIKDYKEDSNIKGIILNKVSPMYYERIKGLIEKECGVEVVGFLPEMKGMEVNSRHLGLIAPNEVNKFSQWADKIADEVEKNINVDRLLEISKENEPIEYNEVFIPKYKENIKIAVAKDEAFSFYYRENIELLKEMGAEIIYFSPLNNEEVPKESDGLILWGGYPENYGSEIEKSVKTKRSVKQAFEKNMPALAECGGFMYLQKEMEDKDGNTVKTAGALKGRAYKTDRSVRFGYIEAECFKSGLLGEKGGKIRGHEFHYWDCTENGSDFIAYKPLRKSSYKCMINNNNFAGGFPHLYYYSNINMIFNFIKECGKYKAGRLAKEHWDKIAKPIDSLGILEENVVKLCRIYRNPRPPKINKKALVIMCGDHGVVSEGVTQTGSEVTKIVSENFAKGLSTVNCMAEYTNTDVFVIDMGMDTPNYSEKEIVRGAVIDRKIERGCKNIGRESAMSVENCVKAIKTGIDIVRELKEKGYGIIATGEMGIGNTTPSTALSAVFLNADIRKITGKGAGLSLKGIEKKINVIERAVKRVKEKNIEDPVEILAEVGGYEIAGMTGLFLGGLKYEIPIVADGAISGAAAVTAKAIDGRVTDYIIASHKSKEEVSKIQLEFLGLKAVIDGEMCLGEGTGAVSVFPLLEIGTGVYKKMGSFNDYKIEPYKRFEEE